MIYLVNRHFSLTTRKPQSQYHDCIRKAIYDNRVQLIRSLSGMEITDMNELLNVLKIKFVDSNYGINSFFVDFFEDKKDSWDVDTSKM